MVAFFGFFRKSTILPVSSTSPLGICRSDVLNFTSTSFEIVVKHSKTIQFGQRTHILPFAVCADQRLCPVRALWSHMTSSQIPSSQHLFAYVAQGKVYALTHPVFVKKLKGLVTKVGLNPMDYSAHSFRRGGSTFAFALNMPLLEVKSRGEWRSNCVERYISISPSQSMQSALLLSAGAAVQ